MFETLLALALAGLLGAMTLTPALVAAWTGLALTLVGLLGGIVAGGVYHVRLKQQLDHRLPAGWYWNPMRYHDDLSDTQWRQTSPWFVLGAASFVVCAVGLFFAAGGLVRAL